jgi:hypothetical protein
MLVTIAAIEIATITYNVSLTIHHTYFSILCISP